MVSGDYRVVCCVRNSLDKTKCIYKVADLYYPCYEEVNVQLIMPSYQLAEHPSTINLFLQNKSNLV